MRDREAHLSDEELVLAADGELSAARERHLADCMACRARQSELGNAAAGLARAYREAASPVLPPPGAARTRLRARLAEMAVEQPAGRPFRLRPWPAAALAACAAICTLAVLSRPNPSFDVPSPRLTPGAARTVDRAALCNSPLPKNREAPSDLRRRVFQVYGIAHADPRAYEVDYLITPALGGADDIRNLWPQPYVSTVWNARVKDELEDRLRDLVCGGQLDLAEAQRAISRDWIAAYKKYFRTDRPVR
jgi:hypothetical protein